MTAHRSGRTRRPYEPRLARITQQTQRPYTRISLSHQRAREDRIDLR